MSARWAVVVFPGSNCERDCVHALRDVLGQNVVEVWHRDALPKDIDCVVLPGGFSYGDYLRTGALAAISPVMESVRRFADEGGLVIGICNGFQILTECGMLPGTLMRNAQRRFRCADTYVRVERSGSAFTADLLAEGDVLKLPIAHGCGNFFAPPELLEEIESAGQVFLRYCDARGMRTDGSNPNGSCDAIAGITNAHGNVLGLMPHPERACEALLGGTDGRGIFLSMALSVGVS